MKCIVGLGNPGKKYRNTRHNVGYMVLDEIAGRFRLTWTEGGFSERALLRLPIDGGEELLLVRPLTYMNSSGIAVAEVMGDYKIEPSGVLVVHDDLDLPLGKVRFRRKGSSGGHRGIESIIEETGTSDFPRLKIGIGRPPDGVEAAEYVLSPFEGQDAEKIVEIVRLAAVAALDATVKGIGWAMARYNGPDVPESGGR
ncbi:MAG TPA: aminoacyl-tRNA hydrolase [Firmicutes bacterium]|nr:aminoacyl-tRNA hydrolase [Candidatus Fermentithermobacillaceae bacterium]